MNVWFESMSGVFHKVHIGDCPPNIILHTFTGPDTGYAHDHPFDIHITVIDGGYDEHRFDPQTGDVTLYERRRGDQFTIKATDVHRIVRLLNDRPCQTLATYGPHVQKNGFWRWENGFAERRDHDGEWTVK